MADSAVTITRTSRDVDRIMRKSVEIELEYLSDDADGSVPDQELAGFDDYVLIEVKPIPDGTAPVTGAFAVVLVDSDGSEIFDSGSIAVDGTAAIGGHTGNPGGNYPRLDNTPTVKILDPTDHTTAANLGNEKVLTVKLRCEKK